MRPEKGLLTGAIQEKIQKYPSFVVMQYVKMSANTANDFRRHVNTFGGDVEVVRKRILMKAAEQVDLKFDRSLLEGHVGLVFLGKDPIESLKSIIKFSNDRDKVLNFLAIQFDGEFYKGPDVERLSTLPSQDEMRAQFLATLEAPMSQTLAVIEALLTSVPHCLDNKAKLES